MNDVQTPAVTRDGFLDNRLMIEQPASGGHRAGLDALLLAAALGHDAGGGAIVDLGAGVGVAGLAAALHQPEAQVTLVDIDPFAVVLCRRNAALNGLAARTTVIEADVLAPARQREAAGLLPHSADQLIMNPPFHPSERSRPSPYAGRNRAHAVEPGGIEGWIRTAAAVLRPQGKLTVIFRADELPRLLAAIGGRFGSLSLLPVHPREGGPAHRVIVRGRPQGRAPLRLLSGLVLHENDGRWRPSVEAVLRGAPLDVPWWG